MCSRSTVQTGFIDRRFTATHSNCGDGVGAGVWARLGAGSVRPPPAAPRIPLPIPPIPSLRRPPSQSPSRMHPRPETGSGASGEGGGRGVGACTTSSNSANLPQIPGTLPLCLLRVDEDSGVLQETERDTQTYPPVMVQDPKLRRQQLRPQRMGQESAARLSKDLLRPVPGVFSQGWWWVRSGIRKLIQRAGQGI